MAFPDLLPDGHYLEGMIFLLPGKNILQHDQLSSASRLRRGKNDHLQYLSTSSVLVSYPRIDLDLIQEKTSVVMLLSFRGECGELHFHLQGCGLTFWLPSRQLNHKRTQSSASVHSRLISLKKNQGFVLLQDTIL